MKVLFDAIKTKWDASTALKTAATGGLHRDAAPQRVKPPFVTVSHVSQVPAEVFGDTGEDVTVQFVVVSNTTNDNEIDDIFDKLTTAYDWCTLTVTGYAFVYCQRILSNSFWNDEEQCWQYVIQYRIGLDKT